jgi:hypothetical protein
MYFFKLDTGEKITIPEGFEPSEIIKKQKVECYNDGYEGEKGEICDGLSKLECDIIFIFYSTNIPIYDLSFSKEDFVLNSEQKEKVNNVLKMIRFDSEELFNRFLVILCKLDLRSLFNFCLYYYLLFREMSNLNHINPQQEITANEQYENYCNSENPIKRLKKTIESNVDNDL